MKLKVVSISNQPDNPGLLQLKRSLDFFRYDYHIIEDKPYIWFGTKIIETYNYVKTIQDEYTHFIFVDAHDVVFIDKMEVIQPYLVLLGALDPTYYNIFNSEKACWPLKQLESEYPQCNSEWKYLNSGVYLFNIKQFIQMVDENPVSHTDDDQLWFTYRYLENKYNIQLDIFGHVMQSMAFEGIDDFEYNETYIKNRKHVTYPSILHYNGKTLADKGYKILDNIINQDNELA